MSACPPPYKSGSREWKTLAGLERAIERYEGRLEGFKENGLHIHWPQGLHVYPVSADPEGGTRIELQLFYDLCP